VDWEILDFRGYGRGADERDGWQFHREGFLKTADDLQGERKGMVGLDWIDRYKFPISGGLRRGDGVQGDTANGSELPANSRQADKFELILGQKAPGHNAHNARQ
jgi:hypothetical protein